MELLTHIRYALWGPFTVLLILGTGVYLTIQTRLVQVSVSYTHLTLPTIA